MRADDPRVQPGAYISSGGQLFLVLQYETSGVGPAAKRLKVENARSGSERWLSLSDIKACKLCRPVPTAEQELQIDLQIMERHPDHACQIGG